MIVKTELIKKVKQHFNLNIYETKVWLALLGRGVASAGEIAELSGVPRSRTYDVLESLEKSGFAIAKLGKPVKYMAVKPTIVVEKLKTDSMRKAEDTINMLSKLRETQEYSELEELHKTGIQPVRQEDLSGAIKGRSNVFNHIKELLENANKEAIICTSAAEILSKGRIFSSIFDKLSKKKISLKVALSGDDSEIKKVNNKFKIKSQKVDINSRFFIADKSQILFMLSNSSSPREDEEFGIWLNSDFFVNTLAYLFENIWKK